MDINDANLVNTLDFVNKSEQVHFARAQLGEQVRAFLRGPAGRYLHGRAKIQLQEAGERALDCNPFSLFGRRKLKKIQHDADVAKAFMSWCADAITEGEFSFRELQEYNNDNRG